MFIEERMGLSLLSPIEGLRAILHAQLQAQDGLRSIQLDLRWPKKEDNQTRVYHSMVAQLAQVKLRPVFHGLRYGYTQKKHQAIPAGKSR